MIAKSEEVLRESTDKRAYVQRKMVIGRDIGMVEWRCRVGKGGVGGGGLDRNANEEHTQGVYRDLKRVGKSSAS